MVDSFNFLQNKYTKWYFNIIFNSQSRDIIGYTEKHHIIPKSLGGSNEQTNLVKLTAREHFICHWLLTKMVIGTKHRYQMWNAFGCMIYRENAGQERYKVTSKIFENIKKEGAKIKSINFSGANNPMFGKTHSEDAKTKIQKTHVGRKKTDQERQNISLSMLGKPKTESHKISLKRSWAKNRESRSGKNHLGYGKPLDENIKEKIRQSVLNMPLHTCEHCGKTTTKGNYRRWHSDNCKSVLGVA
jgi:5-methylcytosine-specific restriction endonuclease McrA